MRIVFVRERDYQRGYALVTRDDGVCYRLTDGPSTRQIPHDLVHFTIEDTLGVGDGIWAVIAGGAVFSSMAHVSGRRPPHAAQRSTELMRMHAGNLNKAEMIANLVERTEAGDPSARDTARWLADRHGYVVEPAVLDAAVAALRSAAAEWARLEPGDELVRTWPAHRRLRVETGSARRQAPARRRSRRAA
jgi:hypothetical protein